jgi:hypothetical protein
MERKRERDPYLETPSRSTRDEKEKMILPLGVRMVQERTPPSPRLGLRMA